MFDEVERQVNQTAADPTRRDANCPSTLKTWLVRGIIYRIEEGVGISIVGHVDCSVHVESRIQTRSIRSHFFRSAKPRSKMVSRVRKSHNPVVNGILECISHTLQQQKPCGSHDESHQLGACAYLGAARIHLSIWRAARAPGQAGASCTLNRSPEFEGRRSSRKAEPQTAAAAGIVCWS